MQAGLFREIIVIHRATRTVSDTGDVREEYKPLGVVRAQVTSQNVRKAMANGEELYPTTRVFRLRMPPEIIGGDRIEHRGQMYEALPPTISPYERVQTVTAELVND
jgi:head-tail adaptor